MEIGLVRKVDIDHEMQQSYLDYAMSVIVSRALPDARDGLKPVQRRILYAMHDLGLRPDSSYKKSARIVGEVMGKYHPHGDMAVYESMARLAQDFTMRYPLVDGQGNFGSVDGDPPAAMRYTEARLGRFAMELLNQLERNTVNFSPNFDGTLDEPDVLPASVPNLLVNGASGIAVGMATSIPPHNLGEVVDALVMMLREWERLDDIAIGDLMKFVKGPDFPTGGIILQESGQEEILAAYGTGRGRVTVRGRVQMEEMSRGRSRLIVTELPYQVNKSALIERIAEIVRDGNLEGISDLRDESDRHGMRIVVELKQGADPESTLRDLYRRTPLQSTFSISLLALVNGEPHLLSLKKALHVYLEHRLEVVRRRSDFDLAKAKSRLHILEGYRTALANLDEIIVLIKAAPDAETARERLIKRFKLSDLQAQAILDMQLRRLASLERKKIEDEYKATLDLIKDLEILLKSPRKMRTVVEDELFKVKEAYADKRRTQIVSLKEGESGKALLTSNDLTPAQEVWIGITPDGLISRMAEEPPHSGKDAPRWLLRSSSHHTLYLVGEDGRTAAIAVNSLPENEFSMGVPLSKAAPFEDGELPMAVFSLPPRDQIKQEMFVLTVSRQGMIKKTAVTELPGPSSQRFLLAKINPGDSIGWALLTSGYDEIMMVTALGMGIRFSEQDVRPMGLVATGVNGLKLAATDSVTGAGLYIPDGFVLMATANGKGWCVPVAEFPSQGRYGQGVQACRLGAGVKVIACMFGRAGQGGILHYRLGGAKSLRIDDFEPAKRGKIAQEIAALRAGDEVVALAAIQDGLALWGAKAYELKPKALRKKIEEPAITQEPLLKELKGQTAKETRGTSSTIGKATAKKRTPSAQKTVTSRKSKELIAVPSASKKQTSPGKKNVPEKGPKARSAGKSAPPKRVPSPKKAPSRGTTLESTQTKPEGEAVTRKTVQKSQPTASKSGRKMAAEIDAEKKVKLPSKSTVKESTATSKSKEKPAPIGKIKPAPAKKRPAPAAEKKPEVIKKKPVGRVKKTEKTVLEPTPPASRRKKTPSKPGQDSLFG